MYLRCLFEGIPPLSGETKNSADPMPILSGYSVSGFLLVYGGSFSQLKRACVFDDSMIGEIGEIASAGEVRDATLSFLHRFYVRLTKLWLLDWSANVSGIRAAYFP